MGYHNSAKCFRKIPNKRRRYRYTTSSDGTPKPPTPIQGFARIEMGSQSCLNIYYLIMFSIQYILGNLFWPFGKKIMFSIVIVLFNALYFWESEN